MNATVDGADMLFNVNDLTAGYDNVTSQFALSAKDQTVLLFRRVLNEAEHESLVVCGKTRCFPIYIVPAYLQVGGKLQDIAVAIATRYRVSEYRCQYYLFDCGSREINVRPETRDKHYSPKYTVLTRLNDIKVLDNSKREEGYRYMTKVNYNIIEKFLS